MVCVHEHRAGEGGCQLAPKDQSLGMSAVHSGWCSVCMKVSFDVRLGGEKDCRLHLLGMDGSLGRVVR